MPTSVAVITVHCVLGNNEAGFLVFSLMPGPIVSSQVPAVVGQ